MSTCTRWIFRALTLCLLATAEEIFHDDFTSTPTASGKWSWDASRFGIDGGWSASQTTSALLLAGSHVWAGYHGQSFKASNHGGSLTVEATWSPGTTAYMDEDFWIGFCASAPSSQSPERTTNNLNLPYTKCVAGQLYDTAPTSDVESYITVPEVGTTRGSTKCKYADSTIDQSTSTRKGLVRQWLTVDTLTNMATFENDLGCDSVISSVMQSGESIADDELWVYIGVDADFMAWLEVESISVKDSSGVVIWSTTFQDRTATMDSWFSHVMYSNGCPSTMDMGSIVNIPDGFLEVTGQLTALEASVAVSGDGGSSGTYITVEAMPDHLAPVLVDNDIAILICKSSGQYTWTKDSTGDCMKFMMLQTSSQFSKQLAIPGEVTIGSNNDFTCATDHFLRLRAIITSDKVSFEDSAGCQVIEYDNPWTSSDTLYVYLAWDEQSTYYTTILDFKIETGSAGTAMTARQGWDFEAVTCPEELHVFIWFDSAVCVPADKFIGTVGPGIADGSCHWGERITYESAGPLHNQDLYYETECASDGSGLAYFRLYLSSTTCSGTPLVTMDPIGLGNCAATNVIGYDFSVKVIGACPASPASGLASASIQGMLAMTIDAGNFDGDGDFTTNPSVITAIRQALARRTLVRVEHVSATIVEERRLQFLETVDRSLQESVTMEYTITTYGATADADATAAEALLSDTDALLLDINTFLDDAYLGTQVVTSVQIHAASTTVTPPSGTGNDSSSSDGDGGGGAKLLIGVGVGSALLVLICGAGCYCTRKMTGPKFKESPNSNAEPMAVSPGDGVVVVGRPIEEVPAGSNNKAVDGTARNKNGTAPGGKDEGGGASSSAGGKEV